MALQINTPDGVYDFEQSVGFDGVYFRLRLYWNDRAGLWFFDLYSQSGEEISLGRPVLVGQALFSGVRGQVGAPAGELVALDSASNDEDPGQDDWGRVSLIYVTAAEVEAALQ